MVEETQSIYKRKIKEVKYIQIKENIILSIFMKKSIKIFIAVKGIDMKYNVV